MAQIQKTGKVSTELETNVTTMGILKRAIFGLLLPVFMLLINPRLMIWVAPISMYVLIVALTHFDFIKWAWLRFRKKPEPNLNEFWDEE
jgi:membrane glycosyltransferase